MSQLKLPWGETLHIESDIEQFSLDVMSLVAEYYVDDSLVVVRSNDFKLDDDDVFVVKGCTVNFSPAFPDEFDTEEFEEKWENFMLKGEE